MFWLGRFNAWFAILSFVGLVAIWTVSGVQAALGYLIFVAMLRAAFRILDVLWTAVTGNPLFYDTKLLDKSDD